ncbi:fumarylacetoacetate hydrolase family protein [Endozoicomonas lisbonensis]|uniref:5-oxopent-3-ene-1,2,5-tricarboxylate decarboxylase/2-hydroxyhepta-2,4-diene-1,7-dioate isomerase n=1 Tax=Endozoicomonas lisbonensis TaxID=3120522 RepID=A0ABV2SIH3_9GAMM
MKRARILLNNTVVNVTSENGKLWLTDDSSVIDANSVEWLPPKSAQILGLAVNSARHGDECQVNIPDNPILYFKLPNSLTGDKSSVQRPDNVSFYTPQSELVVEIGKAAHRVRKEDALKYVSGYTILNNFTAQDFVKGYYRPPVKAKNYDGSGVLGPWIVSADDIENPDSLSVTTTVNGKVVSSGSTADYIHSVADAIAYISDFMTLAPGSLITMGTIGGLVNVEAGDEVTVEISGIGSVTNTLVDSRTFYA